MHLLGRNLFDVAKEDRKKERAGNKYIQRRLREISQEGRHHRGEDEGKGIEDVGINKDVSK